MCEMYTLGSGAELNIHFYYLLFYYSLILTNSLFVILFILLRSFILPMFNHLIDSFPVFKFAILNLFFPQCIFGHFCMCAFFFVFVFPLYRFSSFPGMKWLRRGWTNADFQKEKRKIAVRGVSLEATVHLKGSTIDVLLSEIQYFLSFSCCF